MKTPAFLACAFLAFVLFSCKKKDPLYDGITCTGDCFIVTGIVKDSANNTGLSGAEVRIFFRHVSGGILPGRTDFIGRAISETDGNYTFRFNSSNYVNGYGYFYAEVYKDFYFFDPFYYQRSGAIDLQPSNVNIPYAMDFTMFREAKLKIKLVASDITNFQFLDVGYGFGTRSRGVVINGNGRKIDTTLVFATAGDIGTIINCSATGNGINITKTDTVIVPAKGERVVEFRF